jgi:hypothetical protein
LDKEAMRLLLLPFFIIALVACNSKTASVTSGSVSATAPFVWEGAPFPKTMFISDQYSTVDEQTKINDMMTAWETAMNHYDFFTVSGSADTKDINVANFSTSSLRDGKLSIYKATMWPYPDYPDALAITQIFAIRYNSGSSDEFVAIQEADILVNYEFFEYDTTGFSYDYQTVILHELGHFLGLQHKPRSYNRNNSVMYPSIYSYEQKREPLTIDKQDLASKYSITLPLTAGGSSITSSPRTYSKRGSGETTKILFELKANGWCVHHADGVEFARHQTR